MKSHPTNVAPRLVCFVFFAFLIIISCSKDDDNLFRSSVLNSVPETEEENATEETEEVESNESGEEIPETVEKDSVDHTVEKIFETRTSAFRPINDAYLQDERGYDHDIIRLEEGRRTSYLMFDLSPIDSIGGTVDTSNLEFTIDTDQGNGTISVFKASSNEWSEEELSSKNAPEIEAQMGEIATRFDVGQTQKIALDTALVRQEILTLVLVHEEGDDLAFASKENPNGNGPVLVVTYNAPQDAEAIIFDDKTEIALLADVPTEETAANTPEETTAEETANPEIKNQDSQEEETTQEEIAEETEEKSQEEETTEDEETENEASTEEGATEETEEVEEKGQDGETTQEEATDETEEVEEEGQDGETTQEEATDEATTEEESTEETEDKGQDEEATQEEAADEATAEAESTEGTEEKGQDEETQDEASTEEQTNEDTEEENQGGETIEEDTEEEEPTHDETEEEVTKDENTAEEETTEEETHSEADAPTNESPIAVAEASPSSGDFPLKVAFKGSGSSDDLGVKNYIWDFRDGSTSTEVNPTHTFEKAGTLEVRLTVTDDQGESDTDTVTITINEPVQNEAPKAVASADPTSGEATLEVQFKGADSNDDKNIKNYFWDFKDGSTSTSTNPSHNFSEAGTYEVELSVTDEEGSKDSATITIEVSDIENEAPVAVASGLPLTGDAPLEVQFKGSDSKDDASVTGYFWDFKDGSTTTNKNPSHTFSNPGTYEVELSVKDEEGLTHATTIEVTVNQRPADSGADDGDSGNGGNNGGNGNGGGSDNDGSDDEGDGGNNDNSGNHPANAVFASSFGYNSSDATDAFMSAIKSGKSYVVIDKQSSDWVIRPAKFFDIKNMTIVFEKGVVLKAKSGSFSSSDELFQMVRSQNVKIEGSGATFDMGSQGGDALALIQCNNIDVSGLVIREGGRDGIYLAGDSNSGSYSQNITIENVVSTSNGRNGMSIISVQDLTVRNSEFLKSSGSKTEIGVLLEPNNRNDRLRNITFNNCTFADNDSSGFALGTRSLTSSSTPISITVKNSKFSFNDRSPHSSRPRTQLQLSQGSHADPVTGIVRFEGIDFEGGSNRIIFSKLSAKSYEVVFTDCTAKNVATGGVTPVIELQALSVALTMGGFTFDNFHLEYGSDVPFMRIQVPYNDVVKDIKGNFTIDEPNNNPLQYKGGYDPNDNVNVSINYKHLN